MLYLIISILSAIAAGSIIFIIVSPRVNYEFKLPSLLNRDEIMDGVRRLAAQPQEMRFRDGISARFMRKYCRRAEKIIESKLRFGVECDDYERRYSGNYHIICEAFEEIDRAAGGFSSLPRVGNMPSLYYLLSFIVGSCGGKIDGETLKEYIDAYNAVRPLTWVEICNIKPMLAYVLLEIMTVYASKIIKRDEIKSRAARDIALGVINENYLGYNSYVRLIYSDEKLRSKLYSACSRRGLDADGAETVDAKLLAGYSGGVATVIDSLRANEYSAEYLLSLSVAARIFENEDVVFSDLTTECKTKYIEEISRRARKNSESELARKIVALSKRNRDDIARYIVKPPLGKKVLYIQALCITALSAAFSVLSAIYLFPTLKILCGIVSFPILIVALNRLWLYVMGRFTRNRIVPELKADNAPKTAIIYTIAVSNEAEVKKAFENIQTLAALNRAEYFSYGILIDCINKEYAKVGEDISRCFGEIRPSERFFACLRKVAWERKRGALIQFNDLVTFGISEPFRGIWGSVEKYKYIITLDGDSVLTRAERLVGMMEHPFNSTYNIMSLGMNAKISELKTPFSRLMSGASGISHYDFQSSDIIFNAYGFGNYTGKGIYRTAEFNDALRDAFPDNRILSHDLIEGAVAGCAFSGISGLDEYPQTFSAFIRRQIRWMRGDLQLAPWLGKNAKNRYGEKGYINIGSVAKWQIFTNILNVISPVCSLILLTLCPIFENYIFLPFAFAPQLLDILLSLEMGFKHGREISLCVLRVIYSALWLPTLGVYCLFAICITAWRMITHRNLLRWNTYTASGGRCIFEGNFALSMVFLIFGIIRLSPLTIALSAIFLSALPLDLFLSSESRRKVGIDRDSFLKLARKTWNYFEETLIERNNFLPCDNFQEHKGWANRTSPTNIGLALSSVISAAEIGIISESRRDILLEKILITLSRLERFRGMPYNWYEVDTMLPLPPKYVSSVDCGNLLAGLLSVAAIGGENGNRARKIIGEMDISFLFDNKKGLLYIGYNVDDSKFDIGHYDLLGSEAALTYMVAAGCGKIPYAAYYNLSRRSTRCGKKVLTSWTGGMFEYLLPLLYFSAPKYSLVGKSATGVADIHKKYSRKFCDIYGMSECLYGAMNDNSDYKYKAFGIYSIALSSEKSHNVFAPYAAVMAASIIGKDNGVPALLDKYCGIHGLYDSFDADANAVIKSTMAHHQGMTMLATANILNNGSMQRLVQNTTEGRAAAVLLEEPRTALDFCRKKPKPPTHFRADIYSGVTVSRSVLPQLNYISNGNYKCVIDECGKNYQICDGVLLSRFDRLSGLRVFFGINGKYYEPTAMGKCVHNSFSSRYSAKIGNVFSEITAGVQFDENAENRKIYLKNTGKNNVVMSVIVAAKPCLTSREADLSHKAFSSMFVETGYNDEIDCVYARRVDSKNHKILALFSDTKAKYCGDERRLKTGKGTSFGRTTVPVLSAKIDITLSPESEIKLSFYLAYGLMREIAAYRKSLSFKTEDVSMSVFSGIKKMSHRVRILGSYLLFKGGRNNGALPCVTLSVNKSNVDLITQILSELSTLKGFGIEFTTVIFYAEPVSYFMELSQKINVASSVLGKDCRIINELTFNEVELEELKKNAIDFFSVVNRIMPPYYELASTPYANVTLPLPSIEYRLGNGGFSSDGSYIFSEQTPSPWCNVLSDRKIGCIVSDKGGFTFGANSRQEKLTRHSNDELNDEHGDGIILGEGGTLWSITRSPVPHDCEYITNHNFGYSEFMCGYNSIVARQTVYVDNGVKYYKVSLENRLNIIRSLDVMCFAELVLGDRIFRTRGGITCGRDGDSLYGKNGDIKLYLSSSEKPCSVAFFAESFRDRSGKIRVCAELENDGCTPALVYSAKINLPAKGKAVIIFTLSTENHVPSVKSAECAFERVKNKFEKLFFVESDELPVKYYLKWLAYQTYVSRFTAKCGFQQVGGAIGFRDQLQDSVALLGICPEKVRRHILNCAAHQFADGDVLHWWHEPAIGVRTEICDDKLFLPYAVAEYINYTGDVSVLSEQVKFLKDKPIPRGEHSVYAYMEDSDEYGSVLDHCIRAIKSVKLTERDLVAMGAGDWNDGMDKVGIKGKGESVWCSMFLYYILGKFLQFADGKTIGEFRTLKKKLFYSLEKCFTGDRYIRAFTDDGVALGTEQSKECKIDLLVQSWAVLSGIATGERAKIVLTTAYNRLVDKENGIIKLLDPPFAEMKVGYIADYPKGVRENGGQYTHAAVWFIWALYEAGMSDKANELLEMILPCNHTADIAGVEKYMKEPYVVAGDVYDGALAGRGGWTWYTGSAGWLYRLIIEKYYGIKVCADGVSISPNLPFDKVVNLKLRLSGGEFNLVIDSRKRGKWKTSIGIIGYEGAVIPQKSLYGKTVTVRRQKPID